MEILCVARLVSFFSAKKIQIEIKVLCQLIYFNCVAMPFDRPFDCF